MFRKSTFIMLFVCLMAPVAMAGYPWNNQIEWQSGAADGNWFTAANWNQEGDLPCPNDGTGPGPDFYCAVLPNQPGPRIGNSPDDIQSNNGNATASMLSLNPWDPTSWGGQDCNVTINASAGDCNFGCAVQINSQADYDSTLGYNVFVSSAIVNQYGGTVRTPNPDGQGYYGLTVGGGGSQYGGSYGVYNLYGGLADFPRIRLYFGQINIYGGTMQATDGNFVFAQYHPENKINVNGGTLKVAGEDRTAAFLDYIKNGRLVCIRGGELASPVYSGGYTVVTGTADFNLAWGPIPEMNATNVRYRIDDVNLPITLSWNRGEPNKRAHNVYFGTSFAEVNSANNVSPLHKGTRWDVNGDPLTWEINDINFKVATSYYWRIDEKEVNEDTNAITQEFKGQVWKFTTHDGKAYNPKPKNAATALGMPLSLSWTKGDFAAGTNGHRVYFGTDSGAVSLAGTSTVKIYRGTQSGTSYPISSLYPDYALVPYTTYYWKIQEVNGTTIWTSPIWRLTAGPYVNIDDFNDYNSTADINANWQSGYSTCGDVTIGAAGLRFITDATGKYMQYTYLNGGGGVSFFSEARRNFNPATTFTGGGALNPAPAALAMTYRGFATNAVHTDYDRMYVALEDSSGNIGVYENPDPNAAQQGLWTGWFVSMADIAAAGQPSTVNLQAITNFYLGFGERCNYFLPGGGDGNVMFDDIRLWAKTCNPTDPNVPTADLNNDCIVDLGDLDVLANNWLSRARDEYKPIATPASPILWYEFEETGIDSECDDSGTGDPNNYIGTVVGFSTANWDNDGGRDGAGCIVFSGADNYVDVNVKALSFMSDATHDTLGGGGISFSVWINADMTSPQTRNSWNGVFGTWNEAVTLETLEIHCPAPTIPTNVNFIKRTPSATASTSLTEENFGGRWNHFAFTKSENEMRVYCNSFLVADVNSPGDDNDVYGPLFNKVVGAFRIGTRGGNWGEWVGRQDDFQVYDYCLSEEEVNYLATDGTGHIFVPLLTDANIKSSGNPSTEIVNFEDISIMRDQWHTWSFWP